MIDREMLEEFLPQVRKPARYIGREWNAVKKDLSKASVKIALSFPDMYEVGMSHLGYKLVYHLLNERDDTACERVFMPDVDLLEILKSRAIPLFSLESKEALGNFDILGFTLAYELSYTNVLNILRLGRIPLRSSERGEEHPLVIAGGPSVFNPEPMADFIDLFFIGEAEDAAAEIIDVFKRCRREKKTKRELLKSLARIDGVYVPSFYKVSYNADGTIQAFDPVDKDIFDVVRKRSVESLNGSYYPTKQIVPYISVVHDRAAIEIMRGCPHQCKFCQATVLYRHKRERKAEEVIRLAEETVRETGYEEVSLLSLSSGNHSEIIKIITTLIDNFKDRGISLSLPSLRIEKILKEFPQILSKIKKSGLTFAPEAGSERLRSAMNKKIDIGQLKETVTAACDSGWGRVKLYFMIGLPGETKEDVDGIIDTLNAVLSAHRRIQINASVNSFIPKPHTPLQRSGMNRDGDLAEKISYIKKRVRTGRIKLKFHDTRLSMLEGVFSLGDRRLGGVIHRAFQKGCRLDGWTEHINFGAWSEAFAEEGIDPGFYTYREKPADEILPWGQIETG
ncbi:MAG: TIGR03960 family B12-binding radical SAM protein [Candidatus Omnitrophota bacterium]